MMIVTETDDLIVEFIGQMFRLQIHPSIGAEFIKRIAAHLKVDYTPEKFLELCARSREQLAQEGYGHEA